MRKHAFLLSIFILLISSTSILKSSNDYNNGINEFKQNNYSEAKAFFDKATNDPKHAEDAYLMLSILANDNLEYEKSFEYFLEFFERSSNPYPYVNALRGETFFFNEQMEMSDEQSDFFTDLIEDEKCESNTKFIIYQMLAKHFETVGDYSESIDIYSNFGFTNKWQLLGEFDNSSASGFNKFQEVLEHPEPNYEFIKRYGAKVKWFKLYNHIPGRWIHFSNHFYTNRANFYAQTFCFTEQQKDAQLRIGVSGSVQVWLNDALVISVEEERNNDIDSYITPIKLNAGYNRILVQIGESEQKNSNFNLRITDANGIPLDDIEYRAEYNKYTKAQPSILNVLDNATETFFRDKIKKDPENILNHLLLSKTLIYLDKKDDEHEFLDNLILKALDCSYIYKEFLNLYARSGNETDYSVVEEKIKKLIPDSRFTLIRKYNTEMDAKNYEKAVNYLNKFEKLYGRKVQFYTMKATYLLAKEQTADYIDLVEEAYDKYPDDSRILELMALVEFRFNGMVQKGIKLFKDYVYYHHNWDLIYGLADVWSNLNDTRRGIQFLDEYVEYFPNNISLLNNIASYYRKIDDNESAIEYLNKCIKIAPYADYYYSQIASSYEELKEYDLALENYNKVLYFDPFYYDIRDKIYDLSNKNKPMNYFDEPDYMKCYDTSSTKEDYPEDNSVILIDEAQRVVYKNGGSEEKHYLLAKVLNTQGVDDWKEYNISYYANQEYKIEKAEVIKANGNRLEAEIKGSHIVFTKLEENDGIIIIYKLKTYQYGSLYDKFWDFNYFSYPVPCELSRYSLLVEDSLKFDYKLHNFQKPYTVTNFENFQLYQWQLKNQPSIKFETLMPPGADAAKCLHISSVSDWNFINEWYYDLSETKSKPDYIVRKLSKQLFDGKENLSDIEKARIIYKYVVEEVRYSSISFRQSGIIPQKASKVITTKIGDCKDVATLFVSLCKTVGIKANVVLIKTRDYGKHDMPFPSIDFNHAIAAVILDGKKYYVELTADTEPFSTVYHSLKYAQYLDITKPSKEKKTLNALNPDTRVKNALSRDCNVTLTDNKIKVRNVNVKYGGMAGGMRSTYRDIGEKERKKELQSIISNDVANATLTELIFDETLDNLADSVNYTYSYEISNPYIDINDLRIFKIPWTDAMSPDDLFSMIERNHDIDIWIYFEADYVKEKLTMTIPDGLKVEKLPENTELKTDFGIYTIDFKIEGNKLIANRYFKILTDRIPAAKYQEFKDFFNTIIDIDNKQMALKKAKK